MGGFSNLSIGYMEQSGRSDKENGGHGWSKWLGNLEQYLDCYRIHDGCSLGRWWYFFIMILMIIMAIMIIMTETVISKDSAFSLCSTVVENICKGKWIYQSSSLVEKWKWKREPSKIAVVQWSTVLVESWKWKRNQPLTLELTETLST